MGLYQKLVGIFMSKQVLLVGRTNVGKSTIFNRITGKKRSLVLDQEGVTRDCITEKAEWNGIEFELVDTGGISLVKKQDEISQQIYNKVEYMLQHAAVVLFVCDIRTGLTPEDQRIARKLHRAQVPVFVLVNKADNENVTLQMYEFERLGFEHIFAISAHHALGIADLLDEVISVLGLSAKTDSEDKPLVPRITLIGKPNVGKSSLMNKLLNIDFSIVSDQAGTTREALHKKIQHNKVSFDLVDTAGIRRKKSVSDELETMMVKNSLDSIRKAHIVLLMMSFEEPFLSSQILKLAEYAYENGSALILLINKADLSDDERIAQLEDSMLEYKFIIKKLETLQISCIDGKNVGKVLPLVEKVWERYTQRFSEKFLTDLFLQALIKKPLYKNGKLLLFHHARQIGAGPIRIELIVANPEFFSTTQLGFFENVLRKKIELKSVPVLFYVRSKK